MLQDVALTFARWPWTLCFGPNLIKVEGKITKLSFKANSNEYVNTVYVILGVKFNNILRFRDDRTDLNLR